MNALGQTSAPAESTTSSRSGARKQVKHPGLFDADGNPRKLDAFPEDYNPSEHKPFIRKDFNDETIWLEWRAETYEAKAKAYRDEAVQIKTYGSAEERKAAKKLAAYADKFAALKAELAESGLDVDGILSSLDAKTDEG